jgi:hypothetical protein
MRQYIIAVSEKKGAQRDSGKDYETLIEIFDHVECFTHSPWYLGGDSNENEITYRTMRPDGQPISPEEYNKAKAIFERERKELKIFELKEVE